MPATKLQEARENEGGPHWTALPRFYYTRITFSYSSEERLNLPLVPLEHPQNKRLAPLRSEVDGSLDIRAFNLRTVPPRLAGLARDPLLAILDESPDLEHSLHLLDRRLAE